LDSVSKVKLKAFNPERKFIKMNAAQIHLLLNHAPLLGSLIATVILAWGLFRKNEEIIRVSLYIFVGSALAALPVYFSGEGAEEAVEHLPGVVESLIEDHEHLAKVAIVMMEALGVGALAGIITSFRITSLPRLLGFALLIGGLFNGGVMAQTAHLGGLIRHTEIRNGGHINAQEQLNNQEQNTPQNGKVTEHSKEKDHDD
jgi:hypothetical protein